MTQRGMIDGVTKIHNLHRVRNQLLLTLEFLLLLNASDDAPRCVSIADSIPAYNRQQIPFLDQEFRRLLSDPVQVLRHLSESRGATVLRHHVR